MALKYKNFYILLFFFTMCCAHAHETEEDSLKIATPKTVPVNNHFHYTLNALAGAYMGSIFVHIFDTLATRRFLKMTNPTHVTPTIFKSIWHSYLPVAVGVVPMRALSFGVYSVAQTLDMGDYYTNKAISAGLSGLSLALFSSVAEVYKTKKQIGQSLKGTRLSEIRSSLVPLSLRVVPTVTCMLAGTDILLNYLPTQNHYLFSTVSATLTASLGSQFIGTPAENIRTYRISNQNFRNMSLRQIVKELKWKRLYAGFFHRGLSLGIQASFTFFWANQANNEFNK